MLQSLCTTRIWLLLTVLSSTSLLMFVYYVQPRLFLSVDQIATPVSLNSWNAPSSSISSMFPQTSVLKHVPGWTLFDNLFVSNGTFFLVTDSPERLPPVDKVMSRALPDGSPMIWISPPTAEDIQIITPAEAMQRWTEVMPMDGMTVFVTDSKFFLGHFFHFCGELLYGVWMMLVGTLAPGLSNPNAMSTRDTVQRIIFTRIDQSFWRGPHIFNSLYFFAAWPRAAVEDKVLWQTRSFTTRTGRSAIRYEHALLSDRPATIRNRPPLGEMQASGALVAVNDSIVPGVWWEPFRKEIIRSAGATFLDKLSDIPVITYISRQKRGRRCLRADHHEALVEKLTQLMTRRGWELNILTAEELTPEQQINITARSTVILGVHGNGLTHLLHAPPGSAVIEMLYPGGFIRCYSFTAETRGQTYYAVRNDTVATHPLPAEFGFFINPKDVNGDGGFHGSKIPVQAPLVAELIEKHIDGQLRCPGGYCLSTGP